VITFHFLVLFKGQLLFALAHSKLDWQSLVLINEAQQKKHQAQLLRHDQADKKSIQLYFCSVPLLIRMDALF
jgi:hypothetical protein